MTMLDNDLELMISLTEIFFLPKQYILEFSSFWHDVIKKCSDVSLMLSQYMQYGVLDFTLTDLL